MKKEAKQTGTAKLIDTLQCRCVGGEYDVEFYIDSMDRIMKSVFLTFRGGLSAIQGSGLDEASFMELCWEALEKGRLLLRLCDLTFENDTHLVRYIRKVFENLLREKAETFKPGFRARKKQVERVLKQRCLSSCRRFCGCWKLEEFRHIPCAAGAALRVPRAVPPRSPGSRSAAIKDRDMAEYLTSLLEAVGGMARHEDVLSHVVQVFHLYAVRTVALPASRNGAEMPLEDDTLLSPDHELMARELLEGMQPAMIDLHYCRVVKELTIAETARFMGCSTGTVYNREKRYREYIMKYFQKRGSLPIPEEMEAVLRVVSEKIAQARGGS